MSTLLVSAIFMYAIRFAIMEKWLITFLNTMGMQENSAAVTEGRLWNQFSSTVTIQQQFCGFLWYTKNHASSMPHSLPALQTGMHSFDHICTWHGKLLDYKLDHWTDELYNFKRFVIITATRYKQWWKCVCSISSVSCVRLFPLKTELRLMVTHCVSQLYTNFSSRWSTDLWTSTV